MSVREMNGSYCLAAIRYHVAGKVEVKVNTSSGLSFTATRQFATCHETIMETTRISSSECNDILSLHP